MYYPLYGLYILIEKLQILLSICFQGNLKKFMTDYLIL